MSDGRTRSQPMNFREEEVGRVMERWRASDSCSLVGVGSVGKSNLLQHLSNPSVQAFYMKDVAEGRPFKAIIIDPSMLAPGANESQTEEVRCWAGYELLMHRLFLAFYPFVDFPEEEARIFAEAYERLQDGSNPLYARMGLRYFELGLEVFMRRKVQIVFMFDEFEEMLRTLPIKFFLTLRGLRDANKRLLSYLTFTRTPLPDVVNTLNIDPLLIEPFTELFTDSVIYVGPYTESDARNMINDLLRRNDRKYESYAIDFLLWATGRFAGLIRAGFRALESIGTLDANTVMTRSDQLMADLALKRSVRMECQTIWTSLSAKERAMLIEFTNPRPNIDPDDLDTKQVFAQLQQKKLLRVQGNRVSIEPPVFYSFVINNPNAQV